MYQSRRGSSRDERDSTNQGCCEDVWFGTKSSSDADAARVRLVEEPVEIGQGPEERIDVAIVGDVVPEVGHR